VQPSSRSPSRVAHRGSHRQFKHASKLGRVTVPGKPGDDLAPDRHTEQHLEAGWPEVRFTMRYAVVIEKAEANYSAYVPDLPGCIATGASLQEVEAEIREAIAFHLDGMREDGLPIPAPTSTVEYIELAA
jgi:predicted RNase H-like HicB family nuclease